MKIKILGSGGGEGYPALFCGCEHCNAARKAGGKSLRSLSQTLVDDNLLIDLPADTFTHVHDDHYCPNLFSTRGTDFAPVLKCEKLNLYGNADVERLFEGYYKLFPIREEVRKNIIFHTLTPFKSVKIGAYTVTPLKANHAPEQVALNYVIDDGKSVLLYLSDSGYPTDETLSYIAGYPRRLSCVVMDGTMGCNYYVYHMNFEQNKQLKQRLLDVGIADGKTKFVVGHITHNHAGLHGEIEEIFKESGLAVAYDGMTVEF